MERQDVESHLLVTSQHITISGQVGPLLGSLVFSISGRVGSFAGPTRLQKQGDSRLGTRHTHLSTVGNTETHK